MNKSRFLGLSIMGITFAAGLAGCSSARQDGAGSSQTPAQIVLASPEQTGITVTGRGEAKAAPDVAFFDVGVEIDAPSVAAARNGAAKAADGVIAALKSGGVDARDIQTSSLSVMPRHEYAGGKDRIAGYTVSTSVTVKVRDLDKLGKLIDDATLAGGNASRVQGIRFGFDEPDKLRDSARERAVADARRRAAELARLSGVTLLGPITVEEIQASTFLPPTVMLEGATQDAARMPVERGTGSLALEVRVRWAIKS